MLDPRDDLSTVCASPRTFRLDGVDYPVAKLRIRDLAAIQGWLKDRVPDPRIAARELIRDCPFEGLATKIWERAEEEAKAWPPRIGNAFGEALMHDVDGITFFVHLCLSRTVPGFDGARARDLALKIEIAEYTRLISLAMPEGLDGPKATAAAPTATATTPTA